MLTVACVLSPGPRYDRSHVERLRVMVDANLAAAHQFVCVDDSPWPGWWAKISLFEPGRFSGRVLYLDLDVTIHGALDDLAAYPAGFAIIKEWWRIGFNSSVMAWDAGVADDLFNDFDADIMRRFHGDQDWIWAKMFATGVTFPRAWCVSYKGGVYPDDMRVCVFHGDPKPWDLG